MGWKRKRGPEVWQGCRESKSLFPQGKVICKGIVPKSVTKGKIQSEGGGKEEGGKKWRSKMELELKSKGEKNGSAVVDVLVINKKKSSVFKGNKETSKLPQISSFHLLFYK